MKLALASDLHLEFADIILKNEENADVLILSGDIMVAEELYVNKRNAGAYRDFLSRCSSEFPHVIYVAGNHEFYHGKWVKGLDVLRNECSKFTNVYFLECENVTINDVTFIGGTLWTDMNKGDPLTMHSIKNILNDFRMIRNDAAGFTTIKPHDTVSRHTNMVKHIRQTIQDNPTGRFVVVGHHAPSFLSISEEYRREYVTNGAYASDLSDVILDNPQIKVWTHGHTHVPFDYMIGSTRVVCNPRGYYPHEPSSMNYNLKYYEVN